VEIEKPTSKKHKEQKINKEKTINTKFETKDVLTNQ
jgi:hypothetical protein